MARVGLIPKSNGLMRPGHILAADVRLYYQAVVDSFMYDLDQRLAARQHVYGYRTSGLRNSKAPFGFGLDQWKRFRAQQRRLIGSGLYGALVRTDLAAFFERIPHGRLTERLTSLGVDPKTADELRTLLRRLMGKAHGLPQGPDPSGVLASAYLHPLDQAILSEGYGYVRFVDDIVILARDRPKAKLALRLLEEQARLLDLIVQPAKTELATGLPAMRTTVEEDDEIAGVDYVQRHGSRRVAFARTHRSWLSVARRKPLDARFVKFLLNRLASNRDPVAISWVSRRLGELDWMAPTIARYLAKFADRKLVQDAIAAHLSSEDNISDWEEMYLLRVAISASKVGREILDQARRTVNDRNTDVTTRAYASILLGRHGNSADHDFVAARATESELLSRAGLLALCVADDRLRGRYYAEAVARYPTLKAAASLLKSRSTSPWPTL